MNARTKTIGLVCGAAVVAAGIAMSVPAGAAAPTMKTVTKTMTTTREGQPAEVTVACPAGYHLTGGGGGTGSQDVYLWKSRPTDDGKGWVAASLGVVSNEISPGAGGGMSAPFKVTAYALCESDS